MQASNNSSSSWLKVQQVGNMIHDIAYMYRTSTARQVHQVMLTLKRGSILHKSRVVQQNEQHKLIELVVPNSQLIIMSNNSNRSNNIAKLRHRNHLHRVKSLQPMQ